MKKTNLKRDPAFSDREWLFKSEGQVFGPVPGARLVELIMEGSVVGATEVAQDGGAWQPLQDVSGFLVHVRKAEARARVEAEVTGARKLAKRRSFVRWTVVGVGALVLLVAVGSGAWYLAVRRPWERRSELLADFGDGIAIGGVHVGTSMRAAGGENEVVLPGGEREPVGRPKGNGARHATRTMQDGLVLAQYDPLRIQQVVARRQGSLAACIREEARRSPDLIGVIPLEFAVGNDGKVAVLWIDEPRFKSGQLHDCLFATLRGWAFDRFPGERPVVSLSIRVGPPPRG